MDANTADLLLCYFTKLSMTNDIIIYHGDCNIKIKVSHYMQASSEPWRRNIGVICGRQFGCTLSCHQRTDGWHWLRRDMRHYHHKQTLWFKFCTSQTTTRVSGNSLLYKRSWSCVQRCTKQAVMYNMNSITWNNAVN